MKRFISLLSILICCLMFFVACASTVKINSNVPESKVYIDGESKGVTPYYHTDKNPFWQSTDLKITKEGYKDFQGRLQKTEFNVFHIFSYFWWMDYPAEKNYTLEKQ